MSDYLSQALKACKLAKQGKTHLEVKDALGFRHAKDAQRAINVGQRHEACEERALTGDEIKLLLAVAKAERRELESGNTCSPKLKYLPTWPWTRSKTERVAKKRLDLARKGEEDLAAWQWTGLGLLEAYHGGYVRLRPAGWALVHTIEAQVGAA